MIIAFIILLACTYEPELACCMVVCYTNIKKSVMRVTNTSIFLVSNVCVIVRFQGQCYGSSEPEDHYVYNGELYGVNLYILDMKINKIVTNIHLYSVSHFQGECCGSNGPEDYIISAWKNTSNDKDVRKTNFFPLPDLLMAYHKLLNY